MSLNILTQVHEHEAVVRASQTVAGRFAVWGLATLLLAWNGVSPLMMGALGLVLVFPVHRHTILAIAAGGTLVMKMLEATDLSPVENPMLLCAMLAAVLGGLYLAFLLVRQFARWPAFAQNFPILTLHAGTWIALCLSTLPALGFLMMVPFFSWRLSYMVALGSRGKIGNRFRDHLMYMIPVYGGTTTPYGKGLEFLSRHEASDPDSFARSQLAGIKLLILALMWHGLLEFMNVSLYGKTSALFTIWPLHWALGLTPLADQLTTGSYLPWIQGWLTVYLELIHAVLILAVKGHIIVGCLRLLGFNVFRNTYKPLLAESIVEFWNRFYYYFKELLVDFFFYPAYLRLRSLAPRTRMFAAVLAAAFVGNMYFHILFRPGTVLQFDFTVFWAAWGPRFVYCFLLAVGIWVSMLRQQKARLSGVNTGILSRLRRIAGVWTFYGIIQIWNTGPDGVTIEDAFGFFLSLFGA